jgi:hypothetical protein
VLVVEELEEKKTCSMLKAHREKQIFKFIPDFFLNAQLVVSLVKRRK